MFRRVLLEDSPLARSLVLALPFLVGTLGAQTPPTFQAEYLGDASHVAAMNDSGVVVGTGAIGIYPRAYVAGPGKPITYLQLPLGFLSSGATDVNEAGVIVGVISPYQTTAFYPQPCRWDPDGAGGYVPTRLDTLAGHNRGTADAINDLGDIVGTSAYQSDVHTVLYTSGGAVDLPGLGSYPARSLDNQRRYVSGIGGAFRIDLDTLLVEDLGAPAGSTSVSAWVINAAGQVAADASMAGCTQAAIHSDDTGWRLVGSCGSGNSVYDLNDQGDLLFTAGGAPSVDLVGLGTYLVEDLVDGSSVHWTMGTVTNMALNDARQLAVYATDGSRTGIVLLTPLPPVCQEDLGYGGPGSLQLSVCGGDLSTGTTADVLITGGTPADLVVLAVGLVEQPIPFRGGTLVPVPWVDLELLTFDGAGEVLLTVPGGNGPFSFYAQAVARDLLQPGGLAFSNAIRADFLP